MHLAVTWPSGCLSESEGGARWETGGRQVGTVPLACCSRLDDGRYSGDRRSRVVDASDALMR